MSDPDAKPCGCFVNVECRCADEKDAEIATLRDALAKAREEVEREHKAWSVEYQSGAIWQQRALAAEARADDNLASYERVKALHSEAEKRARNAEESARIAADAHRKEGDRALAAERARDDLGNAFRVVRESCEAERAMGNGGCGCCTLCNKESRERAEVAEAALAKAQEEVTSLRRLNTEIHEAKDALAKAQRICACTEFDDGSAFFMGSFAGGAAPGGAYAYVRCVERKPDGIEVVHHYVPADEDEGTDKAEALVGQVPYDEDMALDHGHGD